jgi:hypothetical protein
VSSLLRPSAPLEARQLHTKALLVPPRRTLHLLLGLWRRLISCGCELFLTGPDLRSVDESELGAQDLQCQVAEREQAREVAEFGEERAAGSQLLLPRARTRPIQSVVSYQA